MTTGAIILILGVIVFFTFKGKGRQWITAVFAITLGVFIGTTSIGHNVRSGTDSALTAISEQLSR